MNPQNPQTDSKQDQKIKNKSQNLTKAQKDSERNASEKENEDPEHEYIAGEKEGDFPPDIKMDETTKSPQSNSDTN